MSWHAHKSALVLLHAKAMFALHMWHIAVIAGAFILLPIFAVIAIDFYKMYNVWGLLTLFSLIMGFIKYEQKLETFPWSPISIRKSGSRRHNFSFLGHRSKFTNVLLAVRGKTTRTFQVDSCLHLWASSWEPETDALFPSLARCVNEQNGTQQFSYTLPASDKTVFFTYSVRV